MKGLNPGPTLFTERASTMYALYMIPLGHRHDPPGEPALRAPRSSVMPVIMPGCLTLTSR